MVSHGMVCLAPGVVGHSGQRTSVKCAEAAWNYKAGGIVHLKSLRFFFLDLQSIVVSLLIHCCQMTHQHT